MKKNFKIIAAIVVGLILIITGTLILFKKDNEVPSIGKNNNKTKSIKPPYEVSLVESDGFSLIAEAYDNGNGLNVFVKSNKNYSYADITYEFFDKDNKIVTGDAQRVNYITSGDEIFNSFIADADEVKYVKVKVMTSEYDPKLTFYNKKELKFTVKDTPNGSNTVVNLSTKNPYNADLLFVNGYLLFYKDNNFIKAEPFKIENIAKGSEIKTTVDLLHVGEYDSIKVFVNEIV